MLLASLLSDRIQPVLVVRRRKIGARSTSELFHRLSDPIVRFGLIKLRIACAVVAPADRDPVRMHLVRWLAFTAPDWWPTSSPEPGGCKRAAVDCRYEVERPTPPPSDPHRSALRGTHWIDR